MEHCISLRKHIKQECIPVGWVPTAAVPIMRRVSAYLEGGVCLFVGGPWVDTPPVRQPFIPHPIYTSHPLYTTPPPPVNRMTDGCKNITFPHTSYAVGKN